MFYKLPSLVFLLLIAANSLATAQEPATTEKPALLETQHLLLVVPKSSDRVIAINLETNSRTDLSLPEKSEIQPIVYGKLAVLKAGNIISAYSTVREKWASIQVKNEDEPVLTGNCIKVKSGNELCIFGGDGSGWIGINLETGDPISRKNWKVR